MVTAFLNERQATTEEMALVSNALAAYSFIAGKNTSLVVLDTTTLTSPLYPVQKLFGSFLFYFQLQFWFQTIMTIMCIIAIL